MRVKNSNTFFLLHDRIGGLRHASNTALRSYTTAEECYKTSVRAVSKRETRFQRRIESLFEERTANVVSVYPFLRTRDAFNPRSSISPRFRLILKRSVSFLRNACFAIFCIVTRACMRVAESARNSWIYIVAAPRRFALY